MLLLLDVAPHMLLLQLVSFTSRPQELAALLPGWLACDAQENSTLMSTYSPAHIFQGIVTMRYPHRALLSLWDDWYQLGSH
jgi:hypothetical protein